MTQQCAAVIYPLRFVASSANPASILPLANANLDTPGMVWAGSTSSYLVLDLGAVVSIDTVAIIGTNLVATDNWRVRASAASPSGIGDYDSATLVAFTGFTPPGYLSDCIDLMPTPIAVRYVRIDVLSPGNPDGQVSIQRIVINTRVMSDGIEYDAEKSKQDDSTITVGAGYKAIDEAPVFTCWKVNMAWISETNYRQCWEPLYDLAGQSRGVLFIPDITAPSLWQSDAIFALITSKPTGKNEFYNGWSTAPTFQAISSKVRTR